MTIVDPAPPRRNAAISPTPRRAAGLASERRRRPSWGLLLGQPIFVALVLAAWVIWRSQAELDSIEQRQLAWSVVGKLTLEHLQLTLVATGHRLLIAIPLGIALTRPRLRRAAPLVVGVRERRPGRAGDRPDRAARDLARLRFLDRDPRALPLRPSCRCCATRSSACKASTRSWSRPAAGWACPAASVLVRIELPLPSR